MRLLSKHRWAVAAVADSELEVEDNVGDVGEAVERRRREFRLGRLLGRTGSAAPEKEAVK